MPPTKKRRATVKPTERMRKEDRKRQLMQHAKALFVSLGYPQTTTDKIARAAGVTEPVLYRHFPSKKAMFLEVLDDIRMATIHRWQTETAPIADPLQRMRAIVDLYLGSTVAHAADFHIMHRSLVETDDDDIANALRVFYLDSEKMLMHVLSEGQESGVFRGDFVPRMVAWELIRTAIGYTLTMPLKIPLYQENGYVPRAIENIMKSLIAPRTP
jgi:TetR/AcrR family transcriptional regulator